MRTQVLAVGVYDHCGRNKEMTGNYLRHVAEDDPDFVITRYLHPVFGWIYDVQEKCESRASVGRFDTVIAESAMRMQGQEMLTARRDKVDFEAQNFTLIIEVEEEVKSSLSCEVDWEKWTPLDLPRLNFSKKTQEITMIIKTLSPMLVGANTLPKESIISYLEKLLAISRCDITRETQDFLNKIRLVLQGSKDKDFRDMALKIMRNLTKYGSLDRVPEYIDYWHNLVDSKEADDMMRKWTKKFEKQHDKESKRLLYLGQIRKIEENLEGLPRELWDEYTDMETFMHSIVYTYIPRKKWQALMTELVLRQRLYDMLEETPLPAPHEGESLQSSAVKVEVVAEDNSQSIIISELKGCFFGDENETRIFLQSIVGMKPKEITNYVSKKVKARKISDSSCHRTMWQILHFHGIYKCSESNWNKQI